MSNTIIEQETRIVVYFLNGTFEETKEKISQEKVNEIINKFKNNEHFKVKYAWINPANVIKVEPLTESIYQKRVTDNRARNSILTQQAMRRM